MNPEVKARKQLLLRLRGQADVAEEEGLKIDLRQAANEIEDLADKLDFRVADRLSEALIEVVLHILKSEGFQPWIVNPTYVSNDGFQAEIADHEGGYYWEISCQRKERSARVERATEAP